MYTIDIDKESKNILLLDSSVDLNEIKRTFCKIITFDFESNRNLLTKKILHEVSDTLINFSELEILDTICLNLCQWYNENKGNEILVYEDINLGSLFRIEFHNFLIPILKKFLTLHKLENQYKDYTFYCSSELHKICEEIGINSIPLTTNSDNIELTWDQTQINLTKSFSLKISKKKYKKIKNFSKIISDLILKKKYDEDSQNTIALIEFDSIKYEKIFQESNNFREICYLYNRHRPVFYNTESLRIIKNSRITPYIPSDDFIETEKIAIMDSFKEILGKFYHFLDNPNFSSFFKFSDIEIWPFIKPNLIKIFEKKILDSIYEIEYAKKFLLMHNIKSVIITSECGFTEQIIIKLAKKFSINVVLLQHGIILDDSLSFNYNKILTGVLPIESDYFFNWGKISTDYIKKIGIENSKIKSIGNLNLDRILSKNKKKTKSSNNVLLLATGPRNHQSVGHHIPTWNEYEQTIKSIYSCVTKNNLNLIIKRHPDTAENDFSPDFYSKLSGVKIFKTGDLLELLNDSYLVISLGVTSSILEAQILEKPVISINVKYDIFGSTKYIPKSCPHIFIDEFENLLSELMNEPDKVSRLIQKGETAINENINNIGESSENLFNTLKRLE